MRVAPPLREVLLECHKEAAARKLSPAIEAFISSLYVVCTGQVVYTFSFEPRPARLLASHSITQSRRPSDLSAMGAAVVSPIVFEAMADDFAAAMMAAWRQLLNRALEAVECERVAVSDHFETFVVIVATCGAGTHLEPPEVVVAKHQRQENVPISQAQFLR